jgi:hypothetical protein
MGLTVKDVARLTRQGKRGRFLDRDGLYLQVLSARNASYILRYELRRKKREMGLGRTRHFSLEEAGNGHAAPINSWLTRSTRSKRAAPSRQSKPHSTLAGRPRCALVPIFAIRPGRVDLKIS